MKKIALVSTFCNSEEKKNILRENIINLKNLGIDVMVISPIEIPSDIINLCDFFFYTKENPLLRWPEKKHTQWYRMTFYPENRSVELHRNFDDYGWASLYQAKKLSQIALSFDYEIFYNIIYDLEIDDFIKQEIFSNKSNVFYPRVDPNNPDVLAEIGAQFMIFNRSFLINFIDELTIDSYLLANGSAEDELKRIKAKYCIPSSSTPIKDKIYHWENFDFFDYSPFPEFKMFISKNEEMNYLIGEDPDKYWSELTDNLRIIFHSFDQMGTIKIEINGIDFVENPKSWEFIEFPISSQSIDRIVFEYAGKSVDFTDQYNKISMNQIYYN